jgi:hypothetical protein
VREFYIDEFSSSLFGLRNDGLILQQAIGHVVNIAIEIYLRLLPFVHPLSLLLSPRLHLLRHLRSLSTPLSLLLLVLSLPLSLQLHLLLGDGLLLLSLKLQLLLLLLQLPLSLLLLLLLCFRCSRPCQFSQLLLDEGRLPLLLCGLLLSLLVFLLLGFFLFSPLFFHCFSLLL